MARWLHFWLTISFLGFVLVNVAQVIFAGWNNFRSMVSGREVQRVEAPSVYNSYDFDSCRNPQALLVTERIGAPLTQFHGAPLRLHMPTRYG